MNGDRPTHSEVLLRQASAGDDRALRDLFELYRGRLKKMVQLRLSQRLRGRVDDSDVLQDAMLEVARTLQEYLREPTIPFYLWLRQIVARKLIDVHRRHLGAEMRDARRDLNLVQAKQPAADSASLAVQLSAGITSPPNALLRDELRAQVQAALALMEPLDREVLALRHFEQLSNREAALVLEIDTSAASKRYTRALERLRNLLPGQQPDIKP
jgi:RNA polymerase sigma-70 factor (ECF subfamily)